MDAGRPALEMVLQSPPPTPTLRGRLPIPPQNRFCQRPIAPQPFHNRRHGHCNRSPTASNCCCTRLLTPQFSLPPPQPPQAQPWMGPQRSPRWGVTARYTGDTVGPSSVVKLAKTYATPFPPRLQTNKSRLDVTPVCGTRVATATAHTARARAPGAPAPTRRCDTSHARPFAAGPGCPFPTPPNAQVWTARAAPAPWALAPPVPATAMQKGSLCRALG